MTNVHYATGCEVKSISTPEQLERLQAYISSLQSGGALVLIDQGVVVNSDRTDLRAGASVFVVALIFEDGSCRKLDECLNYEDARTSAASSFLYHEADYIVDMTVTAH